MLRILILAARKFRWHLGGVWGRWVLRSYGVHFGEGLRLGSPPIIQKHKEATIRLGRNVVILNTLAQNPAGVFQPTVLAACRPGAELIIGDNVGISGATLYAWRRLEIGDHVLVGAGAVVYDTDFHPLDADQRRRNDNSQVGVAPVVIEPDVWLGARSMVLKGVTIGRGAVVAAGAIVTKNVPAGTIVAGVPARVVGHATARGAASRPSA